MNDSTIQSNMKSFKALYAPLASMENDDDDSLELASPTRSHSPLQTGISVSSPGTGVFLLGPEISDTALTRPAEKQRGMASERQKYHQADSKARGSHDGRQLLAETAGSGADLLGHMLMTGSRLRRLAARKMLDPLRLGSFSEDTDDSFLQSLEVCDPASCKLASIENSPSKRQNKPLLTKRKVVDSFCQMHVGARNCEKDATSTSDTDGTARSSHKLNADIHEEEEEDLAICGSESFQEPYSRVLTPLAEESFTHSVYSDDSNLHLLSDQVHVHQHGASEKSCRNFNKAEVHFQEVSTSFVDDPDSISNDQAGQRRDETRRSEYTALPYTDRDFSQSGDKVSYSDDVDAKSTSDLSLDRQKPWHRKRLYFAAFLLKYVLFVLNFFFWVASVAAIVIGAWVLSDRGQLVRSAASFLLDPSAMLCLLGAIIFLVAFCGCLGALRENICLLKVFQISTLVVLVLETLLAMMVFAFYHMPQFRKHLKAGPEEVLTTAIRRYHDDDDLRNWIDLIQKEFRCCGARLSENGYQDWQQNPYFNCTPANPSAQRCAVPQSCCIIERGEYINHMCGYDTINKSRMEVFDRIFTQGCVKGLGLWLSAHDVAIGAVSLGIIVPQVLCVVLTRFLIGHIQRQRVRWRILHSQK